MVLSFNFVLGPIGSTTRFVMTSVWLGSTLLLAIGGDVHEGHKTWSSLRRFLGPSA